MQMQISVIQFVQYSSVDSAISFIKNVVKIHSVLRQIYEQH